MADRKDSTHSPPLIAVGLARCSTDHQDKSIDQQKEEMRAWAEESGHRLLDVFEDEGISGSELDRPGIRALLAYLESSKQKGKVVCWRRNRLARPTDPRDGLLLERRIERTGWRLHFLQGAKASGNQLVDTLMGVIEHHEAGEFLRGLAGDTVRGQLRRLLAGEMAPTGRIPYGYAKEVVHPDGEVKRFARNIPHRTLGCTRAYLVPGDPREVETVRRIFERYASGKAGLAEIAGELNAEGVPPSRGGKWQATSIRHCITNPVYTGDLVWNKISIARFVRITAGKAVRLDGAGAEAGPRRKENDPSDWIRLKDHHEALVPRELFDRANQVREARGDKVGRQRALVSPYALRGLVYCGRCGHPMGGRAFTCAGIQYRRYQCLGYGRFRVCECYMVNSNKLELAVLAKLREAYCSHGLTPAKLRRGIVLALKKAPNGQPRDERKQAALEREDHELAARIQQAIANMGVVTQAVAKAIGAQIEGWTTRRADIAKALEAAQQERPPEFDPEEVADELVELFDRLEQVGADATPTERRDLLTRTVERVQLEFETRPPRKGKQKEKHTNKGGEVTLRPLFPDGLTLCLANRSSTATRSPSRCASGWASRWRWWRCRATASPRTCARRTRPGSTATSPSRSITAA